MKEKKITIEFCAINVPAPFAHDYILSLIIDKDIQATYNITYKEREGLTEEEISEEGYTPDDDFDWEGKIDNSWKDQLLSLINYNSQKTEGQSLNEFTQTKLTVTTEIDGSKDKTVYFDDESLSYNIQEIVQALFETSKRELPLNIKFLQKKNGKKDQFEITLSFAKRNCLVSKNDKHFKNLSWEDGSSFMSLIYQPDYLLDPAKTKKDDLYISFEDDFWFSVTEIEENERLVGFKTELLKTLT